MLSPWFLVPSRLFREAVEEAGVENELVFSSRSPDSRPLTVLHSPDYFIFKALLQPVGTHPSATGIKNLKKLRSQLLKIIGPDMPLSSMAIEAIETSNRSLADLLRDFRVFSFLENVWLPDLALRDVKLVVQGLDEGALHLTDAVVRQQVDRELLEIRKALSERAHDYSVAQSLWQDLDDTLARMQTRANGDLTEYEPLLDFGLVRFGFRDEVQSQIGELINHLFGGERHAAVEARNQLLTSYYVGFHNVDAAAERELASAMLWSAEIDSGVINLLRNDSHRNELSLKVVYAAALLRRARKDRSPRTRDIERAGKVVGELEGIGESLSADDARARLSVGVAYLYFQLWQAHGFRPTWRHEVEEPEGIRRAGLAYVSGAIRFAREASELAPDDTVIKVYALNQHLYYMVEGAPDTSLADITRAAQALIRYKANPSRWHYRFQDTIARYYYRIALQARGNEVDQMLKFAHDAIVEASSRARRDPEVSAFRSELEVEMSRRVSVCGRSEDAGAVHSDRDSAGLRHT
jgi:hypothetical protein